MKRETLSAWLLVSCLSMTCSGQANASVILDWSDVTLSGSLPTFSFVNPTLGNVTLTYSGDTDFSGIGSNFHTVSTLLLGNTGGETLTMSWSNPVTSLNVDIWDIDSTGETGESVAVSSPATISVSYLNPTDIWDSAVNTLRSDGTVNDNSLAGNFSTLSFLAPGGFNSIMFTWSVPGGFTGILGIGNLSSRSVPEPGTLALLGLGLAGLGLSRRRKA